MTFRSTFKISTYLAAMLAASIALLATGGGGAQARSGLRAVARIPTGPYKPYTPCFIKILAMRCGYNTGPLGGGIL